MRSIYSILALWVVFPVVFFSGCFLFVSIGSALKGENFAFFKIMTVFVISTSIFIALMWRDSTRFNKDRRRWKKALKDSVLTFKTGKKFALGIAYARKDDTTVMAEYRSSITYERPKNPRSHTKIINCIHTSFETLHSDISIQSKGNLEQLNDAFSKAQRLSTGDPLFDDLFSVHSKDPTHTLKLVSPELRKHLLLYTDFPGTLSLTHNHLSYHHKSSIKDPVVALRIADLHFKTIRIARNASQNALQTHQDAVHDAQSVHAI